MNGYVYSPSTGGFYHRAIHGDAVPADAVAIADEEHAALMAAQTAGKLIRTGADGRPEAVDPPPPPPPTIAEVKAEAARRLAPTDWLVSRQAEGSKAIPEAVVAYRRAVRDASDAIEAMSPIPGDCAEDKYWPDVGSVSHD